MIDPLSLAQRTAAGDLDAEACAWLAEGFAAWLAGAALADALRLDAPTRLRARNRALRQAADLLDVPGRTPWKAAAELRKSIRRYEAHIVPLLTRDPRHTLGPVDSCLQRAAASGYRLPKTQRQLYYLLS